MLIHTSNFFCIYFTGLTPLMHAIKVNNIELVRKILSMGPNLILKDKNGKTPFHHAIATEEHMDSNITFDNVDIFNLLVDDGNDLANQYSSILYNLAVCNRAYKIAKSIAATFKPSFQFQPFSEAYARCDTKVAHRICKEFNVSDDADKMLEILGNETFIENGDSVEKPPSQCIVKDGVLIKDYRVLLTKVDVSNGYWGLYNFYRIQLWKEKNKDLYILLTNWGRIGWGEGQYQNTPFGQEEQAVEEFEKIFKAKTGNEWSEKEKKFENKQGKYRLVSTDDEKRVLKKKSIVFDLETSIRSNLSTPVQTLLKDIANVSMYINAYKKIGVDYEAVPFGHIKKDNLYKARSLLKELKLMAKTKEDVVQKNRKIDHSDKEKTAAANLEVSKLMEQIFKLSTEYYYLMPRSGYEFTKLQPLENDYLIAEEEKRVEHMLEFEVAERLLLGAQLRKNEINPLDYIYAAMDCSIESIDCDDTEIAPHILRYIYRSRGFADVDVSHIYRVHIKNDQEKSKKFEGNKCLNYFQFGIVQIS